MNLQILVRSLMSEEEVRVTEFGSGEFTIHNEVTDVGFCATELLWLVPGEDFVKACVSWHTIELIDSRVVISWDWKLRPIEFIVNILMWFESQFEWEVTLVFFCGFFTSFIIFSAIWKSNRLNVLRCWTKFINKSFSLKIICWSNMMVGEIMLKEVPIIFLGTISTVIILTVDRIHCHKVARVLTISKEFKSKSWHEGLDKVWFNSRGHSEKTCTSSFEDTFIGVGGISFECNFCDHTYRVNPFDSFASPITWHQITSCIESWIHWLSKQARQLPRLWKLIWCSINDNLAPKVILLTFGGQW